MNPSVDKYLVDGCMRCKFGGTENCKVNNWKEALITLRKIVINTGLTETIKWGVPVYTHQNKNILMLGCLKAYAFISFFKGSLLNNTNNLLSQQGNVQAARLIKVNDVDFIYKHQSIIERFIHEAIALEESGAKVSIVKNLEPIPNELEEIFLKDPLFETAFKKLTLGRQRGYIIYFSQPKQSQNRLNRIEKYKQQILNGLGINDLYLHSKKNVTNDSNK